MSNNSDKTIEFANRLVAAINSEKKLQESRIFEENDAVISFASLLSNKLSSQRSEPEEEEEEETSSILDLISNPVKSPSESEPRYNISDLISSYLPKNDSDGEDEEVQTSEYHIDETGEQIINALQQKGWEYDGFQKGFEPGEIFAYNFTRRGEGAHGGTISIMTGMSVEDAVKYADDADARFAQYEENEEDLTDEEPSFDVSEYIKGLESSISSSQESTDSNNNQILEKSLQKRLEQFTAQIKELETRSKIYSESFGGGGGTNAVQYRDGGTINGPLVIKGGITLEGGLKTSVRTVSSDYIAIPSDHTIFVSATPASVIIRLPDTSNVSNGQEFHIKKIDGTVNTVTVSGTNNQKIDGQLSQVIENQWTSLLIKSNDNSWFIL